MDRNKAKLIALPLFAVAILFFAIVEAADPNAGDPSISEVTLLLPFSTDLERVSHLLTASNGCFKWTTSNPQLVSLEPVDVKGGCTGGVLVTVNARQQEGPPRRETAVIIAEDTASGRTLRCDAFADAVSRIELKTRTRTVNKGDEEMLEVQAYDALGNVFTEVEGLVFKWSIRPSGTSGAASAYAAVRQVPFRDGGVEASRTVLAMEQRGLETGAILVQGADIGQVEVATRLVNHPTVQPISVTMAVRQPLQLEPVHPLYLPPGISFQYKLLARRKDGGQPLAMPDARYHWTSTNEKVVTVDGSGLARALALGTALVSVQFGGSSSAEPAAAAEGAAQGVVNVVEPHSLALRITPVNESGHRSAVAPSVGNVLVFGLQYRVEVELYDAELHRIDTAGQADIRTEAPASHLREVSRRDRGATTVFATLATGTVAITATLEKIAGKTPGGAPVSARQDVVITAPVAVEPASVLLPWASGGVPHQFALRPTGGSGDFKYSAADPLICSVSPAGIVSALALGTTVVTVSDARNENNRAQATVVVAAPASLEFAPCPVEATEGGSLVVEVLAKDEAGHQFDNCSALPLLWDTDPSSAPATAAGARQQGTAPFVFEQKAAKTSTAGACAARSLLAVRDGHAVVVAKLAAGKATAAEVRLFAFRPLTIARPALPAPVTLGSSVTFVLEGGPSPWYLDPSAFREEVKVPENERERVRVTVPGPAHRGTFVLACREHVTQTVRFVTGNMPRAALRQPANGTAEATFECSRPERLLLTPVDAEGKPLTAPAGKDPACGGLLGDIVDDVAQLQEGAPLPTRYHLRHNRTIAFSAVVVDEYRRPYHNSSSLRITWETADATLAAWAGENRTLRELVVLPREGTVRLSVSVAGYDRAHLDAAGVRSGPALPSSALRRELEVTLHRNVEVAPSAATIVNSPRNSLRVEARHGSGNFVFGVDDKAVAAVDHAAGSPFARIVPLRPGVVHVTATDACLGSSEPAAATVRVSDVASLELSVEDLVQVGRRVTATVRALDTGGVPFDSSQYEFIDIRLSVDSGNLVVAEAPRPGEFVLSGAAAGSAVVTASVALSGGKVVQSLPVQIHVFPEFALAPAEVALVPGAKFHLRWSGGPPVRSELSFETGDTSVVAMADDLLGVIAAGETTGETVVRATVAATHSVTRQRAVYGTGTVRVTVRHLAGLRLRSATNRLVLGGGEQSVWVEGLSAGETPLTLAGIGIQFRWAAADPQVVALRGVYDEAGYPLDREESAFGARVVARSVGKTTVTVSVGALPRQLSPSIYGHLSASLQVTVVEPLRILTPAVVLMPPHSSFALRTSKDGSARLRYRLLGDAAASAAIVDAHGVVHTRAAFGTAVIAVDDDEAAATAAVAVAVKPVSHLEVVPANAAARELAVGTTAEFQAILRDDLGQAFDSLPAAPAAGPLLVTESSFPDLVSVAKVTPNATVVVRALRPGQSVLRVALWASPAAEDYIRVHVGHMVEPMTPVIHLGGTIAFTTSFKSGPDVARSLPAGRVWYSENPDVVRIDGKTGVAQAVGVGTSTIYYNGTVFTFTKATVARIGSVELDDEGGKSPLAVAAGRPQQQQASARLHVRALTTDGRDFTPALTPSILGKRPQQPQINHNVQLRCSVVEEQWATARAIADSATGEYYCEVMPVSPPPEPSAAGAGAPETLSIVVAAGDTSGGLLGVSGRTFRVKFLSQFVVRGGASRRDVQLGSANRLHVLDVSLGRPTLTVTPADPSLLTVTSASPGLYNIEVPRSVAASFVTTVELADSATGQRETISVTYKHDEPGRPASTVVPADALPQQGRPYLRLLMLVVTAVLILVTLALCTSKGPPLPPPTPSQFMAVGATPLGPSLPGASVAPFSAPAPQQQFRPIPAATGGAATGGMGPPGTSPFQRFAPHPLGQVSIPGSAPAGFRPVNQ